MSHKSEFDALLREHEAMIARICASYERDRELARELMQEILFAIWRALPARRGESSLKTFVARIAQFRAISHVAKHSRLPVEEGIDESLLDARASPDAEAIAADERTRLLAAVRRLPLTYREPAVLLLEDLTPAEIAGVLGITSDLVAVRLSRARALLRNLLGVTHGQ
ncbi:MAG: sigma-70 family RNA polymerase sigma factor [Steroidobacteraceae bacterium]|nr:sigma-70 family RNA polymerase sigma factor [Steroidobacteraceae bacterium]